MKRYLTTTVLSLFLALLPLSASADLLTNLRAYWKLDESSGNAVDSSGLGYTLTNTGTTAYAAALINNGADFGTANASKMLTNASNAGVTGGAVTLSTWVKIRTEPTNQTYRLIAQADGAGGSSFTRYEIDYIDSAGTKTLKWQRENPGGAPGFHNVTETVTLGTAGWHHLVLSYDGSTITAYRDGSSKGTVSSSGNGSVSFGAYTGLGGVVDSNTVGNSASAYIDESALWDRGLTGAEVTSLYNSGLGFTYPFTVSSAITSIIGLVRACWLF